MSQVFAGAAGKTSMRETVVECSGCGAWYGAAHTATINFADAEARLRAFLEVGFSALNEVCCPQCEGIYVIEEPFLLHLPGRRRFFLILPENQRHRVLQAQAEHLRRLAPAQGALLPRYARELEVLIGRPAVKAALRAQGYAYDNAESVDKGPVTEMLISPPLPSGMSDAPRPLSESLSPIRDVGTLDTTSGSGLSISMTSPKPSEASIDEALGSLFERRKHTRDFPQLGPRPVSEAPDTVIPASSAPPEAAAEAPAPEAEVEAPAAEPEAVEPKPEAVEPKPEVEAEAKPEATVESSPPEIAAAPAPLVEAPEGGEAQMGDLLESLSARLSAPEPSAVESSINRIFSDEDAPLPDLDMPPITGDGSMDGEFDTASIDVSESELSIEVVNEVRDAPGVGPKVPPPLPPHLTPAVKLATTPTPPPTPAPLEAAPEAAGRSDDWDSALDDAWSMDDAQRDAPAQEPTHVVPLTAINPAGRMTPAFDDAKAEGGDLYLEKDGEYIRLIARVDPDRAATFEEEEVILRFQLHRTPHGGVLGFLVVHEEDAEATDHLFWPIPHETPLGCAILDELERFFSAELLLFEPDGRFRGRRVFRILLEENVKSARRALEQMDNEAAPDRTLAREAVLAEGFDRVGRLRHNFQEDSFSSLNDAAEVRLALGILSYWSSPERKDYLLRIKSFPESWFDAMLKRVLTAAVSFGLAIEPHLRQRTLELGLAAGPAPLLQTCLANFAEVNLNLKPNGLDPLDTWENWEALLTLAEELDLQVGEEIEELAAISMERARLAAQAAEPIDLGEGEGVVLDEASAFETLPDGDLVALLAEADSASGAALALLERGEAYTPALFDAIKRMPRADLQMVVPNLLAYGPRFEAAFLGALRSRRVSLRLSSALFLAEIRSTKAVSPLLRLLLRADDALWPILARAIARMGRRVITPALERVERHPKNRERVAQTLALLGTEARGALRGALEQIEGETARWCVTQALELMGEVSFGDAADFTERMEEALNVAGEDDIRPDGDVALSPIITSDALSLLEEALDLDD